MISVVILCVLVVLGIWLGCMWQRRHRAKSVRLRMRLGGIEEGTEEMGKTAVETGRLLRGQSMPIDPPRQNIHAGWKTVTVGEVIGKS